MAQAQVFNAFSFQIYIQSHLYVYSAALLI